MVIIVSFTSVTLSVVVELSTVEWATAERSAVRHAVAELGWYGAPIAFSAASVARNNLDKKVKYAPFT